jgi:YD repeat-containing protein
MRVKISVIFAVSLVALTAYAGDPLTNRGVDLSGVYHVGEVDTVNLFNGNLIVDVPLAAQFPLNGGFSYGIHLIYTGQPWDFPQLLADDGSGVQVYRPAPTPNRRSNAGMGWRVTMGRLIPPSDPTNTNCPDGGFGGCPDWTYESPDGADHFFKPPGSAVQYTDDGSYLRLTIDSNGQKEIDFPDGVIQRFDNYDFTLSAIYTPFDRAAGAAPSVRVASLTNSTTNNVCGDPAAKYCWQITDNFARTQYVTFADAPNLYGNRLAQKIIVTAPGGNQATYTLQYNGHATYDPANDVNLQLDGMGCYGQPQRWPTPSSLPVPLLTAIVLPDGSQYDLSAYQVDIASSPPGQPLCSQGSLAKLTLPTRASIGYTYQNFMHNHTKQRSAPYIPGVLDRTKTPAGGGAAQPWHYAPVRSDPKPFNDCPTCPFENRELMVTVTDPDNRISRHYFSIAETDDPPTGVGWLDIEFGLPFTHKSGTSTTDPVTAEPRYLSTEIPDAAGNVERSTYVKYDYDYDVTTSNGDPATFRREQASLTRYVGTAAGHDAGRWSSTNRSSFDHYGHFRTTVSDGNFAAESPATADLDQRTEFVNYNPARGTWGTNWSEWPVGSPWVLNTFDTQWVNVPRTNPNDTSEAASHTKKTELCFDSVSGFLMRKRVLRNDATTADGITRDGADLITVSINDVSGNIISEKSYGGDGASLADGSLCGLTLPSPRYEIRHTYQNGVRAISQYLSNGTPMPFNALERTIDLSGAVSSEKDIAGVTTVYTPDTADPLRIKTVTTAGTAAINYAYTNASSTDSSFTPAEIAVTQSDVTTRVQYDSFGRLWREFRTMPTGEVTRETLYDSGNRKLSQSVWDSSSYANKTTYHYDFLGRPDSVDPPDHQTVSTSYAGDSARTTTANVFMANDPSSAQTPVTTTERMDRYGRLWYVQEPNGTVTAYGYGVTGALGRVCMNATLAGGALSTATCGQERRFAYDNRGFLTSETHPENGTISYSYDASGHVLTKRPATAGTQFDLNYTYDDAERLKQIDSRSSLSSFHPSKVYTYDGNASGNLGLGKPATAARHNYQTNGDDYVVTETYLYADQAGRLTDRTTEVLKPDGSLLQRFSQSQSYTILGQPASLTYPSCQGSVLCGSASQSAVTSAYTNGLLTSITGFGSLTYHPSGMVKTVSHANGVTDTYDVDDTTGIPRPKSIKFDSFASCAQPSITSQPGSPTIAPGQTATLSVTATPASVTFQWHDADGTLLPGQTSSTFTTPVLNADHSYFVRVSNSCGAVTSSATVHVSSSNPPVITAQPQSTTSVPAHLTVSVTGTSPFTYQWYQGTSGITSNPVGTNNPYFDTPVITLTTKYWVRVSNASGSADSNVATVTVPLGTPSSLTASWPGSGPIQLTWNAVAGTNIHYEIWRRDHGSAYSSYGTSGTASFNDSVVSTGSTYVYEVRAVDANNESASSFSNPDLATTMTFTPLGNGTILHNHVDELLAALNAMQAAKGWPQLTWTAILQGNPAPPPPAAGVGIYAEHILALRRNMDLVYAQLIGTPTPYTDPALPGSPRVLIKWLHITELRSRVQ